MTNNVVKIYELRSIGYDILHTQFQQVTKDLTDIKKAKLDLLKIAGSFADAQGKENQAYKDAAAQYEAARIKEVELLAAKKNLSNEMKAQQLIRTAEKQQQETAIQGNEAEATSYSALVKKAREFYALLKNTPKGGSLIFPG